MPLSSQSLLLVTGGTGLVGGHVLEQAAPRGIPARAIVRSSSKQGELAEWGCQVVTGDLTDVNSLRGALEGVTHVVNCAAMVGDWGPIDEYRRVNVQGLVAFLEATREVAPRLERFVHISSLGVYEPRDHYGTDESTPPYLAGIDGYTRTKAESEQAFVDFAKKHQFPGVAVRPGFIYGPRDRTVLPRLMEKLRGGKVKFMGSGEQLMNNTYVGNLVQGVFLALEKPVAAGEVFNVTDPRLVSKREFVATIAELIKVPVPTKHVPVGVARMVAKVLEGVYRLVGSKNPPFVSSAAVKFLGLNLDFSIEKARRVLGYSPNVDFQDAIRTTIESISR